MAQQRVIFLYCECFPLFSHSLFLLFLLYISHTHCFMWRRFVLWLTSALLLRYRYFLWKRLEATRRTFTSATLAVSWHLLLLLCVCACAYGKVCTVLADGFCVGERHCMAAMGCCQFRLCKGAEKKVVTSRCFCVWKLSNGLAPVRLLQGQKHQRMWNEDNTKARIIKRCCSCMYGVCICLCVCTLEWGHFGLSSHL